MNSPPQQQFQGPIYEQYVNKHRLNVGFNISQYGQNQGTISLTNEEKNLFVADKIIEYINELFLSFNYSRCILFAMNKIMLNFDNKIQIYWDKSVQKLKEADQLEDFIDTYYQNQKDLNQNKHDYQFWFGWGKTYLFMGEYERSQQLFYKANQCYYQQLFKKYLDTQKIQENQRNQCNLHQQLNFISNNMQQQQLELDTNFQEQHKNIMKMFSNEDIFEIQKQIKELDQDQCFMNQKSLKKLTMLKDNISNQEKYQLSHIYRQIGLCSYFQGCYDTALEILELSSDIEPKNFYNYMSMGACYKKKKDYDKALEFYQKAANINPYYAEAYHQQGDVYFLKKEKEQAIQFYDKAIQNDPQSQAVYQSKGYCLKKMKQYQYALECYNIASEMDNTSSNAYNQQGECLFYLNQKTQALEKYQQAVEANQGNYDAIFNWAYCLSSIGRKQDALEKYEEVLKIKPDYSLVALNQALCLVKLGRIEQAIAKFEQSNKLEPKHLKTVFNWAENLTKLKRYQEALEKYEEAVIIKKENPATFQQWIKFMGKQYGVQFALKRLKQVFINSNQEDQNKWFELFYYQQSSFQEIAYKTLSEFISDKDQKNNVNQKLTQIVKKIHDLGIYISNLPKRKDLIATKRLTFEISQFHQTSLNKIYRKEIQREIQDYLLYLPDKLQK